MKRSVITGVGSYIPSEIKTNRDFSINNFYTDSHGKIDTPPLEVVEKFKAITGIEERRYAPTELTSSGMAVIAARKAIEDSGVDPETIDQIILAHNFGDVMKHSIQSDAVPALASRVKHDLGIKNPSCVAYDLLFGWLKL